MYFSTVPEKLVTILDVFYLMKAGNIFRCILLSEKGTKILGFILLIEKLIIDYSPNYFPCS